MKRGKSVKVDTLDVIFSKLIRERADWRCEYENCEFCENNSFRHRPGGLHNSHFRGRRGRSTRWDGDNCSALCNKRHERMGGAPDEHAAWMRRKLGDTRFDALVRRANGTVKIYPDERWEMNQHFKSELKRLEAERANGEMGWIEFVDYE